MTRSLIREEQIVDEDVLSEAEHDAWVHTDLIASGDVVVSGTLTVTGTITCSALHIGQTQIPDSGYTGQIDIVTEINDTTYTKGTMTFENGILTTYSGGIIVDMPSYLLL